VVGGGEAVGRNIVKKISGGPLVLKGEGLSESQKTQKKNEKGSHN